MKKLIPILSLAFIISLFSSCVFLVPDKYSITFNNYTTFDVDDWYVKNDDNKQFILSEYSVKVKKLNGHSTISGLWKDYYEVLFSIDSVTYYSSDYVYLDSDTDFNLITVQSYTFTTADRAASTTTSEESTTLKLVDSKGNEYPLKIKEELR